MSDDEFQEPTSSRDRDQENNQSANGWINMAEKRAKASASTSTSSAHPRTRYQSCTCNIVCHVQLASMSMIPTIIISNYYRRMRQRVEIVTECRIQIKTFFLNTGKGSAFL